MKKLFILLIAIFSIYACKDRDLDDDVILDATLEGKNTGSALFDGKVWVAKIENTNASP